MKNNCLIFTFFLLTCVLLCQSHLDAPRALTINGQTPTSFVVTFSSVANASTYKVRAISIYNSFDNVTLVINGTSTTVRERKSNVIYEVQVRALEANGEEGEMSIERTRTTPNGCEILSTITAPTFITVFLEEQPGATGWEVEYTNTRTNASEILLVPIDTISTTYYVGILTSLDPNTVYTLKARVSQINFITDFTIDQSPYGNSITARTDRLSVFTEVEFLMRNFASDDLRNSTFVDEIQTELQSAFVADSSDVFNVTVLLPNLLVNDSMVYVEILLKNVSSPPDVNQLSSPNSTLYRIRNSPFSIAATGYTINSSGILIFRDDLRINDGFDRCNNGDDLLQNYNGTWKLFDRNGKRSSENLPFLDDGLTSSQTFTFSENNVIVGGRIIFNFSTNTIYGIRQNYLIFGCLQSDLGRLLYNRLYEASLTNNSDKFTVFYTTNVSTIAVQSITNETRSDGTSVLLKIPSNLVRRAISYQFLFNGQVVEKLNESELDSSTTYSVVISGLTLNQENQINIIVTTRAHDNTTSSASSQLSVMTDLNECVNNSICSFNAKCLNTFNGYLCTCNNGYTGNGTFCQDIDECVTLNPCDSNATCINTFGNFTCTCNNGYTGNGTFCQDIDECVTLNPCDSNATCINMFGSFKCICSTGFGPTENGLNCLDINECDRDFICHGYATCTNTVGSFVCVCNNGFSGNGRFCQDIDECHNNPFPCDLKASCINTPGSFICTCNNGYSGNGTFCLEVDECTIVNLCNSNALCINTLGSFLCTCNNGFSGNGIFCVDEDECITNVCDSNATCINTIGSFLCSCNNGFSGNGVFCVDEDECITTNVCDSNATCVNTIGSFLCSCNNGFSGNGLFCVDEDECITTNVCDSNAICINTIGSFLCNCRQGYVVNESSCVDIDECFTENQCNLNGECINTVGSFMCTCNDGYSFNGLNCQDIEECAQSNPCDLNAACTNTFGSFMCTCKTGYIGNGTFCQDIEECTPINPCDTNAMCMNTMGSFLCICNSGYSGNNTFCSDIDECEVSRPCNLNAICINTIGSFECLCNIGFNGDGMLCEAESTLWWIAGVVVGILILLVLILTRPRVTFDCCTEKGEYDLESPKPHHEIPLELPAQTEFSNAIVKSDSEEESFRFTDFVNPYSNNKPEIENKTRNNLSSFEDDDYSDESFNFTYVVNPDPNDQSQRDTLASKHVAAENQFPSSEDVSL